MHSTAETSGNTPDDGECDQGSNNDCDDDGPFAVGLAHAIVPAGEGVLHASDAVTDVCRLRGHALFLVLFLRLSLSLSLCLDREYSYAVLVSLFHIQYAWQY